MQNFQEQSCSGESAAEDYLLPKVRVTRRSTKRGMVQLADTVLFQSTVDRIAQTSTETYRIDDD